MGENVLTQGNIRMGVYSGIEMAGKGSTEKHRQRFQHADKQQQEQSDQERGIA
ncbi:hypothetical protein D3C80_2024620 [compost metagenome]